MGSVQEEALEEKLRGSEVEEVGPRGRFPARDWKGAKCKGLMVVQDKQHSLSS